MLTRRYFSTDSISLEYAEGPDNGSTVIILHGITSRWQENIPLFSPLTFNHKVYALSFRGHGTSFRAASYTVADYTSDVIAFIKTLKAEHVTLIGHSLGGLVSLNIASLYPNLVKSVCAIEPVLFPEILEQKWWKETFASWKLLAEEFDNKEIIYRAFKEHSAAARMKAKSLARLDAKVLDIGPDFVEGVHREEVLSAITCPVHLIYGNQELGGILSHSNIEWITTLLHNWSSDYFDGSGHVPQSDELQKSVISVSSFLESL
ncbi:MAG: alpha/beta hydrolase [Fibrobacterales bacterium]